jgi:glycine/D-amino acid oxidase-like deaminating enzyme
MARRAVADVCVIGGGVIGTSIAMAAARCGRTVVVVDPNPGVGMGSTSYSSGIIRAYYTVRESVQFAWEGV